MHQHVEAAVDWCSIYHRHMNFRRTWEKFQNDFSIVKFRFAVVKFVPNTPNFDPFGSTFENANNCYNAHAIKAKR